MKILILILERPSIYADRHCLELDAAVAHGSVALESMTRMRSNKGKMRGRKRA